MNCLKKNLKTINSWQTKQKTDPKKHRFNQEADTACLGEWNRLLKVFHGIEKDRSKDMKPALNGLIKEATNNNLLTYRQADGIVGRANNVLNGTYGNTKTESQLNAGKIK